jgi:GAF domain-containing protein/HAMP domain-containing protein
MLLGLSSLGLVSLAIYTVVYFQTRLWQAWIAVGVVAAALIMVGPVLLLARSGKFTLAAPILMFGGAVALSANEAAWSGLTWYNIAGSLMLIFFIGANLLPRQYGRYFTISLPYLILMLFANRINPIERHPAAEAPLLTLLIMGLDIFLAILVLTQLLIGSRTTTIRARLVVAFALLVSLPLIVTTLGSSYLNSENQENKTLEAMDAVVEMKQTEIYTLLQDIQIYLGYVLPTSEEIDTWSTVLTYDSTTSPDWQPAHEQVRYKLQSSLLDTQVFEEIAVVDQRGVTKVSTYDFQEGVDVATAPFFMEGLKSFYINPPFSSLGKWSIVAAMPVRNNTGEAIGVLMGRLIMNELNEKMLLTPGLGETGEIFLVQAYNNGKNYRIITPLNVNPFSTIGAPIPSELMSWITLESSTGKNLHNNYMNVPVLGAYRYIPQLEMYLLAEQAQSESQAVTRNTILLNVGAGLFSLIIAVIAALEVTRQMTTPLVKLGETAEKIAAGELNIRVKAEQDDEVGNLAESLDKMARQLRELIGGLENRVAERTAEVERRSNQLQVASQIARDTIAVHDLDELMGRAVELITERFDFYHAGIFLVDDKKEFAILRAATGEAGKRMMETGHKLRVGEEGIVGYTTSTGQPRIALDVGEDAVHFRNPHLPHTRSELALPLRSGDHVMGALDVQSTRGSAFDQQDINILQTLADQLAVAIDNARLFNTMSDTLDQLQVAQQEYTQESWSRFIQDPKRARTYRYRGTGIESSNQALPVEDQENSIQVPLRIREQVVGTIHLKMGKPASEEDILSTVEEISNRLSLVLESARLLEETRIRSEQIRLLQEITSSAAMNIEMKVLLDDITQKVLAGFSFDHCSILMFDPDLVYGTIITAKPEDQDPQADLTGSRWQISNSPLFVDILNSEKSIAVYDVPSDPRAYTLHALLSGRGVQGCVITPLVVRGEVQGAMILDTQDSERRVSQEDLRLLDQIGLQLSVGLDVARLFEMTEQRAQREKMIGEIANRMRESLDIDNVLKTAAREMRKALNLEGITIQLAVPEDRAISSN